MSVQTIGDIVGPIIGGFMVCVFTAVAIAHILHKLGIFPLKRTVEGPLHVANFQADRFDFTQRSLPPRFRNLAVPIAASYEELETETRFLPQIQNHHFDFARTFDFQPTPVPPRFNDLLAPIMATHEEVEMEPPGKVKLRYDLTEY